MYPGVPKPPVEFGFGVALVLEDPNVTFFGAGLNPEVPNPPVGFEVPNPPVGFEVPNPPVDFGVKLNELVVVPNVLLFTSVLNSFFAFSKTP